MKKQLSDPFFALSDPNRREILMLLTRDRLPINSVAENFNMSRPAVSKHIKVLTESGFIEIHTNGRERLCVLNAEGFELIRQWISHFDAFWSDRLGKLRDLMDSANDQ